MSEEESKNEKKKEKSPLRDFLETVLYCVIVAAVCLFIVKFVAVRSVVYGTSMYPTLDHQDNLIVEKLTGRFGTYDRFDVVVFNKGTQRFFDMFPGKKTEEDKNYIKRIIGLPGETVQVIDGYVYINGALLADDIYGAEVMANGYMAEEPITLGEDEYFCMGDNRNNSMDSRFANIGPVRKSEIVGRAWLRIFPFNKFGLVEKIVK